MVEIEIVVWKRTGGVNKGRRKLWIINQFLELSCGTSNYAHFSTCFLLFTRLRILINNRFVHKLSFQFAQMKEMRKASEEVPQVWCVNYKLMRGEEENTHKWLIFSALRWSQRPSWLSSLLGNQTSGINPWWNTVVCLWGKHRSHVGISILTHHVRSSLLSRICSVLLRKELLLCGHRGHRLMGHVLAICGVGESGILRSQQLLEWEGNKEKRESIKCNLNSVYIKASNHHHHKRGRTS